MLHVIIQEVSKLCEWRSESMSRYLFISLYKHKYFSQWLNNYHAALAAWKIFFCKENCLYLQRPTPQTYTVPFYGPHLCVSQCCPVWIDLLVLVSYTAVCQVHHKRKPTWLLRSEVSYLTTSPNREGEQKHSSQRTHWTTSGSGEKLCSSVLCGSRQFQNDSER